MGHKQESMKRLCKQNDDRLAKIAKNGKSLSKLLYGLQNVDAKVGHQHRRIKCSA